MIKINNFPLAIDIFNIIKNGSQDKKGNNFFGFKEYFSSEQLESIESLKVTGYDSLKGIQFLHNLKKLSILSRSDLGLPSNYDVNTSNIVNRISDFSLIERLKKLEELAILNDSNIEELDVSKLVNLKTLVLIGNRKLSKISNIEKLTKLEEILIIGNNIKSIPNIDKFISKNSKKAKIYLDTVLLHDFVRNVQASSIKSVNNIIFSEKTGFLDFSCINIKEALSLYTEVIKITDQLNYLNKYEKIKYAYSFLINTVDYDWSGLKEREQSFIKYINNGTTNNIPPQKRKYFSNMNSSYNALVLKKCNCEGYANAMKLILSFYDIGVETVYCTDKSDYSMSNGNYDHAAFRIKYNNRWYYFDPAWEKLKLVDLNFFLTKESFQQTHILNPRIKNEKTKYKR